MTGAAVALTLLLALAGCVKVETSPWSDREMSFRAYTATPQNPGSKAATPGTILEGTVLPDDSRFGVFAYYQPGVVGSSTGVWGAGGARSSWKPDFMFNQAVDFDGEDYSYSPLRYWPANEENTLSFWAYWPYELYAADNSGVLKFYESDGTTAYSGSSEGLPVVKYTVPQDPSQQYDILFDSFANTDRTIDNGAGSGQVPFTMRHALALVEFRLRESTDATINSMSVSGGICWTGICTDPAERTWTGQTDVGSIELEDVDLEGTTTIIRLLVMPQTLTAAAMLTINYNLEFPSSDPTHPAPIVYTGNTGSVRLIDAQNAGGTSAGITAWAPGAHYVYTINAGYERIEFEVAEDFTTWTSGGTTDLNN